ncbi:hypothetical protein RIF29_17380 [Crotalaria pallida]|uniref:Uncharacterized protein n=1 Tax=Crotalaria pallida TaxID=3830 RepID=A0AAN9FQJ8_CROPI
MKTGMAIYESLVPTFTFLYQIIHLPLSSKGNLEKRIELCHFIRLIFFSRNFWTRLHLVQNASLIEMFQVQ